MSPFRGPYSTDQWGSYIFGVGKDGETTPMLDTRGWGYLTGKGQGALGLSIEDAHRHRKEFADRVVDALNKVEGHAPAPTYHDLHITLEDMARTSIFDLPFNLWVRCSRVGAWEIWHRPGDTGPEVRISKFVLDVAGVVIADTLNVPA